MLISRSHVKTEHAKKYLVQLSKHWAHKFADLTYTDQRADIPLPGAPCVLLADSSGLGIKLHSDSAETLARAQSAVADHLRRFGHREELVITWSQPEPARPESEVDA